MTVALRGSGRKFFYETFENEIEKIFITESENMILTSGDQVLSYMLT